MINLLRGEFYKLFRSKCLYICSIVMAVFVLLIYGMFSLTDAVMQGEVENGTYGVVVSVEEEVQEKVSVWDDMDIATILPMLFSAVGSMIVTIFATIFVYGEYANGAIKNVVGKGCNRWLVFAAKYISTVVGMIVMYCVMLLTVFLCELVILGGDRLNADMLSQCCGYIGIQFLLGAALTGLVVMISQICRNLGAGIAISVCMIMFSSFATTGINAILSYFKINVNASEYWVVDLISNCPVTGLDSSAIIRVILCAIAWFVLAFGVGSIHFGKVDVK